MKNKVIQRFFTVLLGLVMVSPGWAATQYCQTPVQSTIDNTSPVINVTVSRVESSNILHIEFESDQISGIRAGGTFQQWGNGTWKNQDDAVANFAQNWTHTGNVFSKEFEFLTYPTSGGGQIYVLFDLKSGAPAVAGFTLTDVDLSASCSAGPSDDTEAPVMTSASLVSKTHNSAVITVEATDNVGVTKYVVYNNTATQGEYAPSDGKITVTGLTPNTAYTLTIKAKDAAGNESVDGKEVQFTTNGDPKADNTECSGWEDAISEGTKSAAGYNYKFTTEGTSVKVEIEFLEDFTGMVGYMFDETSGFDEKNATIEGKKVTYTFTDKTLGDALKFRIKLAYAGGMIVTKQFTYHIGEDCEEPGPTPELTDPELTITDPSAVAIELAIGATKQITWTSLNAATPTFASSKESVATVSDAGVITAKAIGSATITVKQEETDTYQEATKTITVTVLGDKSKNTECSGWNDDIWASEGGYTYKFSTSGTTVHIEFTAIGNFPGGFTNPQVYLPDVNEFKSMTQSGKVLSYDFENQTTGSDLKIKGYFPREAGTDETQVYTYTVGEDCQPHPVTGVSITSTFEEIEVGQSKTMTAEVSPFNATNKNVTWSITEGEEYASITDAGTLTGNAEGEVTVQVETEDGNKTATKTITVVAAKPSAPSAAPADPTHPADKVKAVYSDTYHADCGFGEWGSGTTYSQDTYGKKYITTTTNNGYFGMEIAAQGSGLNCSSMEYLHADVWVKDNKSIRFVPIHGGTEYGVTKQLTGGQWNSIDIALTEGDWANITNWSDVYQIKIGNAPSLTLWFNNVYFYTTATEMMYAVSATAGDGGSATASAASVASGTEVTFTATPDCGYEFASWTKGGEVIVGAGATYTTPITEETTLTANFNSTLTPATPTLDASNVMSVYGHYGNQTGLMVNPWWDYKTTQYNETTIGDKKMARYTKINFQGMDFDANRMNVSDMQYVHLDLYASVESDIKFALIWQGGEHLVTKHLYGCAIESFDIPLSEFTNADLTTIRQLKFDAQGTTLAGKTLIVQNIYFYKRIILDEEQDNSDIISANNNKVCDVTIARTFTAGSLYTLALPFDMTAEQVAATFGECTMYKLEDSYWKVANENMYIRFAPVTEFEANTPILFTPTTNIAANEAVANEVTIKNGTCETATDLVTFHGTYSKMNLQASNYILAADQYLYPVVNEDYYINGLRGYFSFGVGVSQAPKMARVILHEETTTDNAFLRNEKQEMRAKKVLENGRFVIIRDGARYGVLGVEE